MKKFRLVIGILAVIPIALLIDSLILHVDNFAQNSINELLYLVLGVPILILNMWAWVHPEIIEFYFLGKSKKDSQE